MVGQKPAVDQNYRPEFIRLVPPLHECHDEVSKSVIYFTNLFIRIFLKFFNHSSWLG